MYVCYMKKSLLLSLFALTVITACKKDSIGTKPVITFKSYSYTPIDNRVGVDITFEVKDGDGDIENSFNWAAIYDRDSTREPIFTARQMPGIDQHKGTKLTADVILHLGTIDIENDSTNSILKDSVRFVVFVIDNKDNSSDTIKTPKVEVLYPQQ